MKNNLDWKVLWHDFNTNQVKAYNIFSQGSAEEILEYAENSVDRKNIKEAILKWARYHYWCRAEHEIMVGGLFSKENEYKKIDIFYQIEMNINRITDYFIGEVIDKG